MLAHRSILESLARWVVLAAIALVLQAAPLHAQEKQPASKASKAKQGQLLAKKKVVGSSTKKVAILSGRKEERQLQPIIVAAANRHKVDSALVKAIILAESGYNPRAVSKVGARGLMQLMPRTAKSLGVKDSFNPEHNINAGVRYFKKLLNQFGDVKLALAAYNAGGRNVRKYNGVPPYKATRYYIKKVLKYYQIYKRQMCEEEAKDV
jgi:soluble lytic murein transglycosylase-like protein